MYTVPLLTLAYATLSHCCDTTGATTNERNAHLNLLLLIIRIWRDSCHTIWPAVWTEWNIQYSPSFE